MTMRARSGSVRTSSWPAPMLKRRPFDVAWPASRGVTPDSKRHAAAWRIVLRMARPLTILAVMLKADELEVVFFTLRMAALSTLLILAPGVLAAAALARYRGPGKSALETLLSLPLVLPPTAVGILLLELLARRRPLGAWLAAHDIDVVFTWKAVLLATAVMSFPLLVRQARTAFEAVDPRLPALARTLGCGPWSAFFRVTLPLARRGILAGTVLAFSRALGEFGATVLVAGNI